jgi:cell division septation protein DedD
MKAFLIGCGLLASVSIPALAGVKEGVDAYIAGDYTKALAEWRAPAQAGDPDAEFNMGQAYNLGHGVPVDKAVAMDWFRKAAAAGHAQAQAAVGISLFQAGKRDEALTYLRKAADQGEAKAQYIVATAYFNGDSLPKDWVKAYALMTRSKAQGIGAAATSLAQMDQAIPEAQRQAGLALARELERSEILKEADPSTPARTMVSRPSERIQPVAIPASQPASPPSTPVASAPAATPKTVVTAPIKTAVAKPKPVITITPTAGGWKIQLGAFSTAAAAKTAWGAISASAPAIKTLTPNYTPVGAVTRLQAGPFANRAAADQACAAVKGGGGACFPVGP